MFHIQALNINKSYGRKKVLENTTLKVEKGKIIIIEGPSGVGKTTFLNILSGIDSPDNGKVLIDNKDIFEMNENKRAKFRLNKIGIIFQDINLIEDLNVMENIALPLKLARKKWEEKVDELVRYLKIEDLKYSMPSSLSGGEIQRCAIARAIANEPEIIIADEPTSNLDDENTENIMKLIEDINNRMGTTVIIASHDPRVNYKDGKRFLLEGGKLHER